MDIISSSIVSVLAALAAYLKILSDREKTKKERDVKLDAMQKEIDGHAVQLKDNSKTFLEIQVALAGIQVTLAEIKDRLTRQSL